MTAIPIGKLRWMICLSALTNFALRQDRTIRRTPGRGVASLIATCRARRPEPARRSSYAARSERDAGNERDLDGLFDPLLVHVEHLDSYRTEAWCCYGVR